MPRSESILSDLGLDWDEGLTIPVANAENKYLEEDVSTHILVFNYFVLL